MRSCADEPATPRPVARYSQNLRAGRALEPSMTLLRKSLAVALFAAACSHAEGPAASAPTSIARPADRRDRADRDLAGQPSGRRAVVADRERRQRARADARRCEGGVRGPARVHRAAPVLPQPREPRAARARSRSRCRRTPRCRGSRWRTTASGWRPRSSRSSSRAARTTTSCTASRIRRCSRRPTATSSPRRCSRSRRTPTSTS